MKSRDEQKKTETNYNCLYIENKSCTDSDGNVVSMFFGCLYICDFFVREMFL